MSTSPPSPPSADTNILQHILSRLDLITTENQTLRADLARLTTANTQTALQQRQEVIRNSRASLRMDPTTRTMPSPAADALDIAAGMTPETRFRRRLTTAEMLVQASPLSPSPPIPVTAGPGTAAVEMTEEEKDSDVLNPTAAGARTKQTGSWTTNEKGLALLVKKLEAPPVLSGSPDDKVTDARQWVTAADEFMDIHLGAGSEGGRLQLVIQWTAGAPKDWLRQKRREVEALLQEGRVDYAVEWKEVKHEFIEMMEGPQYRLLQRTELEALRLGRGKCKTVLFLNSEFDRLAVRLWPSGTDLTALDLVLGDEYGQIIQRSDITLWQDIHRGFGIPQTLAEWKSKTATAWAARQVINRSQSGVTVKDAPNRWGGQSLRSNGEKAAIHNVDAALEGPKETWQRLEGEQEPASLQQVSASPRRQAGGGSSQYQLSEEERTKLMAAGRCFQCFVKGHRSADASCPGRGKPRRKPTLEDLKA
jgi:hypothetical protein